MNVIKIKTEYYVIGGIVLVNMALHLIADCHSGFHGDELLHIEAGKHLAFGYMDFPPMIGFLAFILNLFHSDSIFIYHLLNDVATAFIFVLCGLITIQLGGKWLAVLLTLSCILFAPGLSASHALFLPDVFDQLAWIVCIWLLVKYGNSPQHKYLMYIGIFAALGFLTKYSITFLLGGLVVSVLIVQFNILRNKMLWISVLLFLLIVSPNIVWQITNGFPVFHHFSKLYETQLDKNSQVQELKSLFLYLNPFTSVFWLSGLFISPFVVQFKKYRLTIFTLLFAFLFLFMAKGKAYYYFPVILGVLPLGTVLFEQLLHKRKWILVSYFMLVCGSGIYLLPHGIPLFPLDEYINNYHFKKNKYNKIPLPFENYYSAGIWNQLLKKVDSTYKSLPVAEQKNCLIWGRHYSQAGGINLLGKKYGLPQAFSFHSSFYSWVPRFSKNITIIAISDANLKKDYWLQYFSEVNEICTIENQFTSDYKWYSQHIFLCRKLKYNSDELKALFKNEIF